MYPYYAFPLPLLSKLRKRLVYEIPRSLACSFGPFVSPLHENSSFILPRGEEIFPRILRGKDCTLAPDRPTLPESLRTCAIGGTMQAAARVSRDYLFWLCERETQIGEIAAARTEDLHYEMARNAALVNHSRVVPFRGRLGCVSRPPPPPSRRTSTTQRLCK